MLYKILIPILLVFAACKKDSGISNCTLKNTVVSGNTDSVRIIIDEYISRLSSKEHTPKNLQKLAEKLSGSCIKAEVRCNLCIYSNPPQSQIQLEYPGSTKVITISSMSITDNDMRFVNIN